MTMTPTEAIAAGLEPLAGPFAAMEKRIRGAMAISERCKASYAKNGHGNQYNYARGQIDSFQAVLNWINEQHHDTRFR